MEQLDIYSKLKAYFPNIGFILLSAFLLTKVFPIASLILLLPSVLIAVLALMAVLKQPIRIKAIIDTFALVAILLIYIEDVLLNNAVAQLVLCCISIAMLAFSIVSFLIIVSKHGFSSSMTEVSQWMDTLYLIASQFLFTALIF